MSAPIRRLLSNINLYTYPRWSWPFAVAHSISSQSKSCRTLNYWTCQSFLSYQMACQGSRSWQCTSSIIDRFHESSALSAAEILGSHIHESYSRQHTKILELLGSLFCNLHSRGFNDSPTSLGKRPSDQVFVPCVISETWAGKEWWLQILANCTMLARRSQRSSPFNNQANCICKGLMQVKVGEESAYNIVAALFPPSWNNLVSTRAILVSTRKCGLRWGENCCLEHAITWQSSGTGSRSMLSTAVRFTNLVQSRGLLPESWVYFLRNMGYMCFLGNDN